VVSKSSRVGEISYGFVSQKSFQAVAVPPNQLWGGYEFGSQQIQAISRFGRVKLQRWRWVAWLFYLSNIACRTASHHLLSGKMHLTKIRKEW
jgi:hypothetical protein